MWEHTAPTGQTAHQILAARIQLKIVNGSHNLQEISEYKVEFILKII
jgi:hypothetical protein